MDAGQGETGVFIWDGFLLGGKTVGRGGPRIVDPCQPTAIEEERAGLCLVSAVGKMRRGKGKLERGGLVATEAWNSATSKLATCELLMMTVSGRCCCCCPAAFSLRSLPPSPAHLPACPPSHLPREAVQCT